MGDDDLKQKLADLQLRHDRLTRSFLHDLKNPLAVALGSIQVAKMTAGDSLAPRVKRLIDAAEDGCKSELTLMQNLSDSIKIDMGEFSSISSSYDPKFFIKKALDKVQSVDSSRTFTYHLPDTLPRTWGDTTAFERILDNLLENCLRHTKKGGNIHLSALMEEESHLLRIDVRDDGESITTDRLESIFDRHYLPAAHSHDARRDIGLGLAFARRAARLMNGDLIAIETQGQGAYFKLTLPLADAKWES
jgi:K+-sensing histidine kinase KdpD